MGALSLWHWAIVLAALLLLLGRGTLAMALGSLGRYVREVRHGIRDVGVAALGWETEGARRQNAPRPKRTET